MSEQPALNRVVRDLVKAERERDEALAALARVRALADECDRRDEHPSPPWDVLAATIRESLEGP